MIAQELKQGLNILEDAFAPSEAKTLINAVLEQAENTYKLRHLGEWIGDHKVDATDHEYQMKQLARRKEVVEELLQQARKQGREVEVVTEVSIRIK